MKRRGRLVIAMFVIFGAGLCVAAGAASVLTVLDSSLAVPEASGQQRTVSASTAPAVHGLEIALFLAFSVGLILISVIASVSDGKSVEDPTPPPPVGSGRSLRTAPIQARRQEG